MSYIVEIDWPSGKEYYTEIGKALTSGQGKAKIISISEITRAINPDKSFENSVASIELANTDSYFSNKMVSSDQYILGRDLKIYSDDTLIFSGKVSDIPRSNPNIFQITADVNKYGYSLKPNKVIKKADFPNVPADNEGKYGNIIFGTASDEGGNGSGILTAYRVDTNKYLLAWHHVYSLIKVYDGNGTDITSSCTLDNNADGNAYIDYTSSDNEIYVNCYGMTDSSGNLIENPAKMLEALNDNFGSFTIDGISDAETIFASRGYENGSVIVIDDDITWEEVLHRYAINFDCLIFQKANGNLGIKVLDWGTEVATKRIKEIYVDDKTFELWRDMKEIINEYRRMYWYHFRKDFFHRLPADIEASTNWQATRGDIDLRYIKESDVARDVASRLIFFKRNPIIWYSFNLPRIKGDDIELADVIEFRYKNGLYPNAWRMIQIFRKTYSQGGLINFEAMDITGINQGLIQLWDESDDKVILLKDESDPECNVLL